MTTKKSTGTPVKAASKTASKTSTKPATKSSATKSAAAGTTAAPKPVAAAKGVPTHEEISRLAHEYWKERGHNHGSHEDDWHRAEQELKSRP